MDGRPGPSPPRPDATLGRWHHRSAVAPVTRHVRPSRPPAEENRPPAPQSFCHPPASTAPFQEGGGRERVGRATPRLAYTRLLASSSIPGRVRRIVPAPPLPPTHSPARQGFLWSAPPPAPRVFGYIPHPPPWGGAAVALAGTVVERPEGPCRGPRWVPWHSLVAAGRERRRSSDGRGKGTRLVCVCWKG